LHTNIIMTKFHLLIFTLALIFCIPASTVFAQAVIQLWENQLVSQFPDGVRFHLHVVSGVEIESIVLVYGMDGRTCQQSAASKSMDFEPASSVELDWDWEWKRSGILPPGTQLWWQWEITAADGATLTTPKEMVVIQDQRYSWKSITGNGVTVQWHQGDEAFGEAIHTLAVESLGRIEAEMGLTIEDQIDITIYPTAEQVREALLTTTEWTGGVAFPDHNSMIIGVAPTELDWAGTIIPHELNHLVVGALVFNCHGVWLPTWLSEGLAEMSEGALINEQRDLVISALEEDRLPALISLTRSFSAYGDSAHLSYVQSSMVVRFLVEGYGPERLAQLLAIMQAGDQIDSALEQVYGLDTPALDSAWRASLGFAETVNIPGGEMVAPTSTLVPTIAPIEPSFQVTSTSPPTSVVEPATPTAAPTATAILPTSTPASLELDPPLAPPAVESGLPSSTIMIVGVISVGLLALLVILHRLSVRRR
jgi:hypothetical protein